MGREEYVLHTRWLDRLAKRRDLWLPDSLSALIWLGLENMDKLNRRFYSPLSSANHTGRHRLYGLRGKTKARVGLGGAIMAGRFGAPRGLDCAPWHMDAEPQGLSEERRVLINRLCALSFADRG